MKVVLLSTLFFFSTTFLFGQTIPKQDTSKHVAKQDTIKPNQGNEKEQLKEIKAKKVTEHSDSISHDSTGSQPKVTSKIDTTVQNKYGDLLNDDTAYNK